MPQNGLFHLPLLPPFMNRAHRLHKYPTQSAQEGEHRLCGETLEMSTLISLHVYVYRLQNASLFPRFTWCPSLTLTRMRLP